MNRTFKRLAQGGILNVSDKVIKFTFDGKTYSALQGDTIEIALLANNILNHGRSVSGYFLASASGLYPTMTSIDTHIIAMRDFKITHGLKLSQTNKMNIKKRLLSFARFFTSADAIPKPIIPINANRITQSLINHDATPDDIKKFTAGMVFNIEKSYLHTDIVITGMNIFALQAALIYANAGLKVIICDTANDIAYSVFYNQQLQKAFNHLKTKIETHTHITVKKMTDIYLVDDKNPKTARIVGLSRHYAYECHDSDTQTETQNTHHDIELCVINAQKIMLAPCLQEMSFLFQGHHLPAVMGCREFIDLHLKFGLMPNTNIVIYVSNDMAYDILAINGMTPDKVNALIDTRLDITETMANAEKAGYKLYAGYVVTHATGKESIESVTFKSIRGDKEGLIKSVECHLLLQSSGYERDVSLFNPLPQAIKVSVSDTMAMSIHPNLDNLSSKRMSVIGYSDRNTLDNLKTQSSVYDSCHEFLRECHIVHNNNDNDNDNHDDAYLKPQTTRDIQWQHPEFYGLHDLCRKENVLFPQNIHYSDFIQILYRYDNPLTALNALKQNHNFYGNHHAIRILLSQMQKIYNLKPSEVVDYYQKILVMLADDFGSPDSHTIMDTISVCGNPKLHIVPSCDANPNIYTLERGNHLITPDYKLSASEIHDYYQKIKNYAGIRVFNDRDMIDISGHDAIAFINKIIQETDMNPPISTIAVGTHLFIHDTHCKIPILLIHYSENRFCLIASHKAALTQSVRHLYETETHLKVAVHTLNQSWAYLQIIGTEAETVFKKIIKMPMADLPNNIVNLWIENIQLRFVKYDRYNIPHIDIMIASDAAVSFYQKLTDNVFGLLPFSQPIYDMIALEAGHIFDMPLIQKPQHTPETLFTTQALAMPLVKTHISLCGGDIYPETYQDHETPQGIMLSNMVFSPYYNQYLVPTLLKGDFHEWENKIVSVVNKDKQYEIQVKIISDKMLKIQEVA